jgi:hypothetical protein
MEKLWFITKIYLIRHISGCDSRIDFVLDGVNIMLLCEVASAELKMVIKKNIKMK